MPRHLEVSAAQIIQFFLPYVHPLLLTHWLTSHHLLGHCTFKRVVCPQLLSPTCLEKVLLVLLCDLLITPKVAERDVAAIGEVERLVAFFFGHWLYVFAFLILVVLLLLFGLLNLDEGVVGTCRPSVGSN